MRRFALVLAGILFLTLTNAQSTWKHGRLKVTKDGRNLQYEDGTPFFWLGDTGWEIFSRLKMDEIKQYIDNRVAKGFNVIQVVALSENDMKATNRYGQASLINGDPKKPNEKYFLLVDSVVKYALSKNIFLAIVPTWADKVSPYPQEPPPIFDSASAYSFGKWIGNRYKNYPNIIWVIGGDRPPKNKQADYLPVWRAMANGIIQATDHKFLMTYHPAGRQSSSAFLHQEKWLDFNMMQSSHGRHDEITWEMIKKDRALLPTKPVLDGEPNYEDHPVAPWPKWNSDSGYYRDYDVRKQLYRSVFAGGFGVTYGHHSIWQFANERDVIINFADRGWRAALDRPGAYQAGYLKKLIESKPYMDRVPDSTIVAGEQSPLRSEHIEAFRAGDNSYAMIYLPIGKTISINTKFFTGDNITAWWFNPKNGNVKKIGTLKRTELMEFTPPTTGMENDWVLVLGRELAD